MVEKLTYLESEEDYRERMDPAVANRYLRAGVPSLDFIQWTVLETRPGYCKSLLPISFAASNQHGVHQAAIMAIAVDYTGGTAVATILRGYPLVGVHPQKDDDGASVWTAGLTVRYQSPSSADVTLIAEIGEEQQRRIRRRFLAGSTVLEKIAVSLQGDGIEVATGEVVIFAKQSQKIRPGAAGTVPHPLFAHKLKASARLIAALRALESERPGALIRDPFARVAAEAHGMLLAERFLIASPQLLPMVAARTRHCDELLLGMEGLEQVVLLGSGLDLRPFRLRLPSTITVYEVDFPAMLVERERVVSALGLNADCERVGVGLDLELEDLVVGLRSAGLDASKRTLFVSEGTSMYLDAEANGRTLRAVAELMGNPESRLWIDHVRSDLFTRRMEWPAVDSFLDSMERLGEPFVFGVPDTGEWLGGFGP